MYYKQRVENFERMKNLKKLIAKDIFDCLTEEERGRLEEELHRLGIDEEMYEGLKRQVASRELTGMIGGVRLRRRVTRPVWWGVAAAVVVLLVAVYWLLPGSRDKMKHTNREMVAEVQLPAPERKEPTLILGDGQEVSLTRSEGENMVAENVVNDGSGLVYAGRGDAGKMEMAGKPEDGVQEVEFHTVVTPKGGEYNVKLEDGTRMWFNECTRVRFPVAFAGERREVFVEAGEVYLEVAHEAERPFVVHTVRGDVRVLGTSFNVRTLMDSRVQTTLVKGSVEVTGSKTSVVLRPNQQAEVGEVISVQDVDVEEVVCWKDNRFYFKDVELERIMDRLAEWYGFTVFYENPGVKEEKFFVSVDKYADGEKILKVLEEVSDVRFRVDGKVVRVHKITEK